MTKYGGDNTRYSIQDNNSIEQILRKEGVKLYLETCGCTSMINCIMSIMDYDFSYLKVQPEDYVCLFQNDLHNYNAFKQIRNLDYDTYMGNEIIQLYPFTAKQLFNVEAEFKNEKDWNKIIEYIKANQSVQLCEIDPGHFIAVVGVDTDTNELIVNDPWQRHYSTGGFNHRISKDEYDKNINPWLVLYKS